MKSSAFCASEEQMSSIGPRFANSCVRVHVCMYISGWRKSTPCHVRNNLEKDFYHMFDEYDKELQLNIYRILT